MDKLKDYIQLHRAQFDDSEPADGHFERFKDKMMAGQRERRLNPYAVWGATAAVFVMLIGFTLLFHHSGVSIVPRSGWSAESLPLEIHQVDEYYRYRVSQKQQTISNMLKGNVLIVGKEIASTMAEMNKSYDNLRKDLVEFPSAEKAAYILSLHYQVQLDVMDQYIAQLQNEK